MVISSFKLFTLELLQTSFIIGLEVCPPDRLPFVGKDTTHSISCKMLTLVFLRMLTKVLVASALRGWHHWFQVAHHSLSSQRLSGDQKAGSMQEQKLLAPFLSHPSCSNPHIDWPLCHPTLSSVLFFGLMNVYWLICQMCFPFLHILGVVKELLDLN